MEGEQDDDGGAKDTLAGEPEMAWAEVTVLAVANKTCWVPSGTSLAWEPLSNPLAVRCGKGSRVENYYTCLHIGRL